MARICLVYASTDGHTKKICERLRALIGADANQRPQAAAIRRPPPGRDEQSGKATFAHEVELVSIDAACGADLAAFDKVVIGASIRYGRHNPLVIEFVNANAQALDSKPSAFFSVNIVARKPQKNRPETNPYVRKFLQQSRWHPNHLDVFAGKLDYPRYGVVDRMMIRIIMWVTHGPTDPRTVVEFTDWNRVEAFAQQVATM